MRNNVRQWLLAELVAQGFTVDTNAKGFPVARRNGVWVATLNADKRDQEGWNNAIAQLRRAGFQWPPPDRRRSPKP